LYRVPLRFTYVLSGHLIPSGSENNLWDAGKRCGRQATAGQPRACSRRCASFRRRIASRCGKSASSVRTSLSEGWRAPRGKTGHTGGVCRMCRIRIWGVIRGMSLGMQGGTHLSFSLSLAVCLSFSFFPLSLSFLLLGVGGSAPVMFGRMCGHGDLGSDQGDEPGDESCAYSCCGRRRRAGLPTLAGYGGKGPRQDKSKLLKRCGSYKINTTCKFAV
jgi:hypothetical protein